eukprot:TRINITY_DN31084_c0_g1_i1.p1 TRINITY_DN31084_c0_g1~~TRINITY_DN31084_c0_g1_i1.p1  ORF type:complete len:363 (+),score=64.38 TRINITY_DN31084_c0_g1_i1:162-1250(+)
MADPGRSGDNSCAGICPPKQAADGMVVMGGLFNAALDAYSQNERSRVEEVALLRSELKASQEREAKLREEMQDLRQFVLDEVNKIRRLPAVRFDIVDLQGSWFCTTHHRRLNIDPTDGAIYEDGKKMAIVSEGDGTISLGEEHQHTLNRDESTAKRLLWTGKPRLIWLREMPAASQQVTIMLDVTKLVCAQTENSFFAQRVFEYRLSMLGCDVFVVLSRNNSVAAPGKDGDTLVEGMEHVGAFFGLRKHDNAGAPPSASTTNAITCSVRIEIASTGEENWVQMARSKILRYEAGGAACGDEKAMPFEQFFDIVGKPVMEKRPYLSYGSDTGKYRCRLRITLTDVGLQELSRKVEHVLEPCQR